MTGKADLRGDLSEGFKSAASLAAARQAGLDLPETIFMSLAVYSGAGQFALVGLTAAGASWVVAAVTGLLLSPRHVLHGPSLARHPRRLGSWRIALVAYGITVLVGVLAYRLVSMAG